MLEEEMKKMGKFFRAIERMVARVEVFIGSGKDQKTFAQICGEMRITSFADINKTAKDIVEAMFTSYVFFVKTFEQFKDDTDKERAALTKMIQELRMENRGLEICLRRFSVAAQVLVADIKKKNVPGLNEEGVLPAEFLPLNDCVTESLNLIKAPSPKKMAAPTPDDGQSIVDPDC